ncbi:GvpL/GvpF family gas vesicle protein [Streptomyces sp. RS10V-4]|uniref:GvpL/GvpF family gas vesicle protein n=1 Tax=Streptomyces rhizoryzae TaxID=2932493 RepID=UPI002002DF7A|nr:GvpL/GvpF family gas vesicle protein [Streptomyces rhizoryzae]MCK7624358.1 GvpL/GvpF family gas vesicle protein [Streptomyces rhizoryzae]
MTEVTYAYGVARDADGTLSEALAGVAGVAGAPVRLVRAERRGDVVVAAGSVPAEDFDEDALRGHLEDLDWLEAVARAHHRVIERLADRTTVLPLRLATVYLNDDRVRAMLGARLEVFARRLSELDGLLEWGVKIYVDTAAAEAEPGGGPAEPFAGSGRDYLRRRRAVRNARDDAFRGAEEAAERVVAAARGSAVERAQHRPQEGALAGGTGQNVVNDAYLVPVRRAEQFRSEVERAADGLPGIRVEVTGPWAPYSFTAAPEAAARGSGP